ncbi:MAG: hypothetical protein U1E65_14935 [Myxococcota bacterium]
MSCPHTQEIFENGSVPRAHLEACAECQAALESIAIGRRAVERLLEPRDEIALRKLWRATEARIAADEARRRSLILPAALLAAAAVILAFVATRIALRPEAIESALVEGRAIASGAPIRVGQPIHPGTRASFEPRARLLAGGARVVTGARTELEVGPELEPGALFLRSGYIAVAVDERATPFVLRTPELRLEILGGVLRLRQDDSGTNVQIESGSAEVFEGESEASIHLLAGTERRFLHRAQAAISPSSPVPEPPALKERPRRRAPPPPPAAEPPTVDQARAALNTDAKAAQAIAEAVLASKPPPRIEVEALMIGGDAARRSGDLAGALALYGRVSTHPAGSSFAEEATLKSARLLRELGRGPAALQTIASARSRWERGALWPEREALAAQILRENGDLQGASKVLEAIPSGVRSAPVDEERNKLMKAESAATHGAEQ